jgi:hypothetical protein
MRSICLTRVIPVEVISRNYMSKKPFLIIFCFTLLTFFVFGSRANAQSGAADLFDEFCADCHSIGEGDMKGPDLLGVERKHKEDWLIKFIGSSKTMISSGDKKAVEIWQLFEKKKMPDNKLSEIQIKSLIQYIGSFNKSKIVSNETKLANDNKTTVPNNKNQKLETLNSKVDTYDSDLQNLEKKLDLILEYNKKSFAARITDDEILKGKELFEGHRPFTNDVRVCSSCHNTYKIDTLNWNPSALDIAKSLSNRNNMDMSNIIVNPISGKMKEVLKDHKLTDDESFYITAFLQSLVKTGLKEHKKIPFKLIAFVIICLIMILSITDLLFTHIIKKRWINVTVFILTAIFIGNSVIVNAKNIGISKNYSPVQPIKFSHKIHVNENKIQCIFCHNSPEFSRESGIPSTNVCMICHNKIKSGKNSGQFEINKIKSSFKNKKPIEWIKIHNLPDHVFFSHAQHVSVGKIDCRTCHGEIDEMDRTFQYSSLSMGWCINCHREKEVQFENNMFYSNHEELHNDLKSGKITKVTADKIGANDCQKCHY